MLDSVFVLHRQAYRESSQLLDLYSQTQGRISAIHRVSKKKPALQPFTLYGIQLAGKGELKNISQVEALSAPFTLHKQSLYCGFYINELLQRLVRKYESNTNIFTYYQQALEILATTEEQEPCLRRFESQLLNELGYGFSWQQDNQGQAIQNDGYYLFDSESGFFKNPALQYGAETSFQDKGQSLGFSGAVLNAIAHEDWHNPETWKVAKQVMRIALHPLLGDKPLVSRSLFQASASKN